MSDSTDSLPDLRGPTARIVAALVGRSSVQADALPELIRTVYQALGSAGTPAASAEAPRPEPAVPINKSVFPDRIICLEDGKSFKTLRRHLQNAFGMTPDQYRRRWGLPPDYPMTAAAYTEHRSTLAKSLGLGRPRKTPAADGTPAPKKRKAAGSASE